MSGAEVAQLASAVFTALTALAALLTVRHIRFESRVARDAFEAETEPLLTDVPRGVMKEEIDWHEASGEMSRRLVDRSEISVGTMGSEPIAFVSVPVRNVGNGCARVRTVTFLLADRSEAQGGVRNPVLPPGELTEANLTCAPNDNGANVAESIGMEYQDFAVIIDYADASNRPRGAARFDIANGQYPHIAARMWASSGRELR